MDWTGLADNIWRVRWWFVPAFAALYLVPLLRIAGFAFECGGRYFMRVNRLFGMWEHAVFLPRDTLVTAYLAGGFLWHLLQALQFASMSDAAASLAALLLISAGWAQRSFRRQGHLKLAEFVRRNQTVHPQEFFDHLLCTSGAVRHRLPAEPMETVDSAHLNFRNGRGPSKLRWFALARGAWSTAWLAHILVVACDMRDARWVRRLASGVALVWAARVAQLMRTEVAIEGAWNLPQAGGPQIFLYTHASFIDFALAPLVLASRPRAPRKRSMPNCTPSFLLAKDHFRDNPLYYRILGIGKAAAALGMIFVERGEGGSAGRARRVVWEAAEKLVEEGMELGIYPQGTRAAPCVGVKGERLDSAYYTVGSPERIKRDGAHLKKGAAFIATEAAMEIAAAGAEEELKIVPVAIRGTGIACPRGSSRVMAGVPIRLVVGEPISVPRDAVADLKSPEQDEPSCRGEERYFEFAHHLHHRIDAALRTAAQVHGTLERRFFEDIRDMLGAHELEEISLAIKPWRGEDCLLHAILDAVYACPPTEWRRLLGELTHLMLGFASRDELLAFKARVADEIPL